MEHWQYDISVHTVGEIVGHAQTAPEAGRVLFCGQEGQCFFDDSPNPYLQAIIGILNARGAEGWILTQAVLRQQDMICFWRRPLAEAGL